MADILKEIISEGIPHEGNQSISLNGGDWWQSYAIRKGKVTFSEGLETCTPHTEEVMTLKELNEKLLNGWENRKIENEKRKGAKIVSKWAEIIEKEIKKHKDLKEIYPSLLG
jgi:hypothetical protein